MFCSTFDGMMSVKSYKNIVNYTQKYKQESITKILKFLDINKGINIQLLLHQITKENPSTNHQNKIDSKMIGFDVYKCAND